MVDFRRFFEPRFDCIKGHLQDCSQGVQQLMVEGLAAMRSAGPCVRPQLRNAPLPNAAPTLHTFLPPLVLVSLSVVYFLAK
jgi:hypothetical protein